MKIERAFLLLWLPLLLTSCPWDDQLTQLNSTLKDAERDLNNRIDETRKTLAEVSQGAIRAVPGERYLQLIDDLNSGDPDKKKKAQDFLKSLAGIDVSVQYDATVWFDHLKPNDQLEAAVFRAATPTFNEITVRLSSGNNINRTRVNGSPLSGQFVAQGKQSLSNRIYSILNDAFGQDTYIPIFDGNKQYITIFNSPKGIANTTPSAPYDNPSAVNQLLQSNNAFADKNRHSMADALADAIFDPYSQIMPPNTGALINEKNWSLIDGRQFIFVIIREDDFDRLKNRAPAEQLVVTAVVHKQGDPATMVSNSGTPLVIDLNEFVPRDGHPDFDFALPNEPQKYVWAAHNMTDFQGYDPDTAAKVKELATKLDKWEKLDVAK